MRNQTTMVCICLMLLISYACKKNATEDAVSISSTHTSYDTLVLNVKINGDTNSYDELYYGFMDVNVVERTDSVLLYSKIMAENFNYERAYYDYLRALCEKNHVRPFDTLSELDVSNIGSTSKQELVEWLKKMLQKGVITQEEFNSVKT